MVDVGHLGCVRSGFCCQRAPCAYGESVEDGTACRYLEIDETSTDGVTYLCGRYEWIVANVADWRTHPAFGAGCNAPLFNPNRAALLRAKGLDSPVPIVPTEAEIGRIFMRARDLQETGRLTEAEALYRGIVVVVPTHAPSLHRLAQIARGARQHDYAVWLLDQALAAGASDPAIHAERGDVLRLEKQFVQAADAFARAAALAPGDPSYVVRQAAALTGAGQPEAAIVLIERLLVSHPDAVDARWTLALAQRASQSSEPL